MHDGRDGILMLLHIALSLRIKSTDDSYFFNTKYFAVLDGPSTVFHFVFNITDM